MTSSRVAATAIVATLILVCGLQPLRVDAQIVSASSTPRADSVAMTLAQSGYVALPFTWDPLGHQIVDATLDTTTVSLNLDSGFNGDLLLDPQFTGLPSVHATTGTGVTATVYGKLRNATAMVDRIAFRSLRLTNVPATIQTPGLVDGYLGMGILSAQRAVVDFATDTLYLLSTSSAPTAVGRQHATHTLREALTAAGQYDTFLTLAQEAGIQSLLDAPATGGTMDSLAWMNFRPQARGLPGVDTIPDGRARVLATRAILNTHLRQHGQLTVFVPTDAAFAQLDPDTLRALRADRARLAKVIRAHVLTDTRLDTLAMRTLIDGASQPDKTALRFYVVGSQLDVERLSSREEGQVLARATIVELALTAANGIAYGIDHVLLGPPTPVLPMSALTNGGYVAIPLYRRPNGWYMLRATINGTHVSLVVDTGAPCELVLDNPVFQSMPKPPLSLGLNTATVIPVDATPVDLSGSNLKDRDRDIAPVDGIVGSTLLKMYHAYLDYATATLYVAAPKPKTP